MRRPHNYKIESYYQIVQADPVHLKMVLDYVLLLHQELLPALGMFPTFEVYFVKEVGKNTLGRYIAGTHQWPVFAICMRSILEEMKTPERRLSLKYLVETTILHELGHAIQEWHGKGFTEDEAEEFAQQYYLQGKVWRFW